MDLPEDPAAWPDAGGIEHDLPFDPRYGYDPEALRAVGPPDREPGDFDRFWRGLFERAMAADPQERVHEVAAGLPGRRVFEVDYDSLGGVRIGGWLSVPEDGVVERGVVVYHGYGGREAPAQVPIDRCAAIFPCARGFHRSARSDLPDSADRHVVHGIASRDTYIHGGCAADAWLAASVLQRWCPESRGRLDFIGGSFGGGLGALLLPWDDRFASAFLGVPSFGNHPLRVTLRCTGSGHHVSAHVADHPEAMAVLACFDAATAAKRLTIPVLARLAVFDPSVPPPGQFAVYNALAGPKRAILSTTGHFATAGTPHEDQVCQEAQRRFFAAPDPAVALREC